MKFLRSAIIVILFINFSDPVKAQEDLIPSFFIFSAGWFDFMQQDNEAAEGRIGFRAALKVWKVQPFIGTMVNSDGAFNSYIGVAADIFLFNKKIVITPSFAPGIFRDGKNGKKLNSTIEFRTQVEISYVFNNNSRVGVSINHISNGGIKIHNPGTESLALSYFIPLWIKY